MDHGNEIIFGYSRADALRDGNLIDLTRVAKMLGFRWPLAITDRLLSEVLGDLPADSISPVTATQEPSAEQKTNWFLAHVKIKALLIQTREVISQTQSASLDQITFNFEAIEVIAHIGPGDTAEPVFTLMTCSDV
jgi:hypothetical protein